MNYKSLFPIFKKNPDLHYLDSGATTLKPQVVLDKMMEYYTEYSANIHRGLYPISDRATTEFEKAREKVAKFIGAETEEVVFTSGTTESINMVARGLGLKNDDEVVVEIEAHHSNFVPWQQMATIKFEVTKKTKVLAITQISNVLGEKKNIKKIIAEARKINPEIIVMVDGAQAVGHIPVDVKDIDSDFYAFSGHKMYSPTGVGVLYGKKEKLSKLNPAKFGGGMIKNVSINGSTWTDGVEKFEGGTPAIAEVIGLGAAVDFISQIGFEKIQKHEAELRDYLISELDRIEWIKILGQKENRVGLVAFYVNKNNFGTAHDVADILGRDFNVCVRAGHHCAMPLHEKYDVLTGTTRVSLGIYNEKNDIDKLIEGLKEYERRFV